MISPPPFSPPPEAEPVSKRSEAVFRADRLEKLPGGWTREITYFFEGEEYVYALESRSARDEEDARRIMLSPKASKELDAVFLRDVRLDMTRAH